MLSAASILARHRSTLRRPPTYTPCNHYPDGPLLGNGDVTCVLGGPGDEQCFYVGKSDFWTDGEGWEMTNEHYDNYVVAPVVIGGLRLLIRDYEIPLYRNTIDLHRADVRGEFTCQGHVVRTHVWTAATANVIVLSVELDAASKDPVGFRLQTWAKQSDQPQRSLMPTQSGRDDAPYTWVTRQTWDRGRWVSQACIATRVLGMKTSAWSDGASKAYQFFVLHPGQRVTCVATIAGGKDAADPRSEALDALKDTTPARVDELRRDHEAWWDAFWQKSLIDLDGDVVEKYWYGAQYALGCCSRAGHVCPGLFGFATDDHPRWNGDYHLNYNGEHPFLGVYAANRAELAGPYYDVINAFMPEGRRRAKTDVSPPCEGVFYPIGLAPWGVVAQDDYMSQKCAAAYAAVPFIEHFDSTHDVEFARRTLYPFVREVGAFWESYLKEEGGRFVIRGSASHEHGGNDFNTCFDLPLVRRLFVGLAEMAEAIGVDREKIARWRDIAARLAAYPTATHEGKRVLKEAENAHTHTRSISLFNVMWPGGGDVAIGGDPALLETCRNTLDALNLWEQGNSFSWAFPAAARVGYPGLYEKLRDRLAAEDGLRENMTLAQAYGGIETSGGIAAVNEMLMQSVTGVIRLFPSWPAGRDARFERLRARGGVLVSASIRDGVIGPVELRAERDMAVRLCSPWPDRSLRASGAELAGLPPVDGEGAVVEVQLRASQSYVLQPL